MDTCRRIAPVAGRILMAIIFIVAGIGKITTHATVASMLTMKGVPLAGLVTLLAIVIEVLGGLALLSGFHARDVSIVLFLYLIPVTLTMHNFWAAPADQQQMQIVNFMKNLAIMGGLLMAWSSAPESRVFRLRK